MITSEELQLLQKKAKVKNDWKLEMTSPHGFINLKHREQGKLCVTFIKMMSLGRKD